MHMQGCMYKAVQHLESNIDMQGDHTLHSGADKCSVFVFTVSVFGTFVMLLDETKSVCKSCSALQA